jgi:hypothetical protein
MTLLSISNAVADETHGPRPATIIGNTNPEAQNILRLINKVGVHLTKSYPWSILRTEHTFTAPGVEILLASGAMPSDFDRFIPETFWDRDSSDLLSGPVSPVEWAGLKVQDLSSQNKKFTWRGGAVLTNPVFSSGVNMAFEYIKLNWCEVSAGGTEKASMTIDTDITIIDEELVILGTIYDWLLGEGQPWQGAAKSYKDYFDLLTDNEIADGNVAVTADIFAQNSRHFTGDPMASRAS